MSNSLKAAGNEEQAEPISSNLFFDLKRNREPAHGQPAAYEVTDVQCPALEDLSLTDLYLTREHLQEPHWHPNAAELVYNLMGEVTIAVLNPFTSRLQTYNTEPGQGVYLPSGWYHWLDCRSEKARVLMIYNHTAPVTSESSDVLRYTPAELLRQSLSTPARQLKGSSDIPFAADSRDPDASLSPPSEPVPPERQNAAKSPQHAEPSSAWRRSAAAEEPVARTASISAPPDKRPPASPKKASNIRNLSANSGSAPSGIEPSVWRPAVAGLQVRIGSTIHST